MSDDRAEAELIWRKYYGNAEGLATHLIDICLTKLGVVYHVFAILDDNSDFDVACFFKKKISEGTLQLLLETNEGIGFCKFLYQLLDGLRFKPFQPCSIDAGELFFFKTSVDNAKAKPNITAQPRKLTDAEIGAYKKKAKKGETFKEEVVWELPITGPGFYGL